MSPRSSEHGHESASPLCDRGRARYHAPRHTPRHLWNHAHKLFVGIKLCQNKLFFRKRLPNKSHMDMQLPTFFNTFLKARARRAAAGGARAGPDADRDDTTHHISPRYVHLRAHIRYVSISSRSSCRAPVHRRLTRRVTRVVCCALWFFCVWVHSALQSIPIGFELIGDHDRRRQAD